MSDQLKSLGACGSGVVFFLVWGLSFAAEGALMKKKSQDPRKIFISDGILTGGRAPGRETSLLAVEKQSHRHQKRERIIISIGDANGYPTEYSSYFHVAIDKSPPRVVVDMSRMRKTAVSEKDLVKILKSSFFVRSPELTMDPEDHSTNITFNLTAPTMVAVHERFSPRHGTQLVLDLRAQKNQLKKTKKKRHRRVGRQKRNI